MDTTHESLDEQLRRSPIPFLSEVGALKHLDRTGWKRFISSPESVASHSWRVALIGLFAPRPLNIPRCVVLGVVHDIAETVVGDIPTFAGCTKESKRELESNGIKYLASLVQDCDPDVANLIQETWLDYEDGRTPEGRWMRDMDKFECLLQAGEYEDQTHGEKDMEEFQGLSAKVSSHEGMHWAKLAQRYRTVRIEERSQSMLIIFLTGVESISEAACADFASTQALVHISLQTMLQEESTGATAQSEYISECLLDGVDLPVGLIASLLRRKLRAFCGQHQSCFLIQGFPADVEQLTEFERKVYHEYHIINLIPEQTHKETSKSSGSWNSRTRDLKGYLDADMSRYSEVVCNENIAVTWPVIRDIIGEQVRVFQSRSSRG